MKKTFRVVFWTLVFGFSNLQAQIYWETDFETARKKAFKTGKKVLIECFHPECSHCVTLNKNLQTAELAAYFNNNYTNIKLNLTDLEQVKLLEGKNIRLTNYPIFLFFDNNGNFQYFVEPRETPQDIIRQFEEERGNSCIDCEKSTELTTIEKVRCATFQRLSKNYEKSNTICSKFFNELPEEEKTKIGPWTVFKKVAYSTNNDFFRYYINNLPIAANLEGNTGKEQDVLITIIQSQLTHLQKKGDFAKWEVDSLYSHLTKLGANEKQKLSWLWSLELNHYLVTKDFQSAKVLCSKMSENFPDVTTFGFLSERINEKLETNEMHSYFLEIQKKWFEGLNEQKQKLQYYKQAAIYYGKNKQKLECKSALNGAVSNGLSENDRRNIEVKYCQ